MNRISLKEFALHHNTVLTRRKKQMSESYLYRLIREDIKGNSTRKLWFNYELEGEKDRIWITLTA
ncbi:MAG: hypothetical protein V4547_16740 [Bacteroidota bacterium]